MNASALKNQIVSAFTRLSFRERAMIVLALVTIVFFILASITSSIIKVFETQSRQVSSLERNFTSTALSLDRYDKLLARLHSLEKNFQKEGPQGGVRSYLENSVMNTAGAPAGSFVIKPGVPRPLGENYSQSPFSITYSTVSISKIVSFLKELTSSESSLLLTKLEIIKGRSAEKLTVTVDVSSISNAKK